MRNSSVAKRYPFSRILVVLRPYSRYVRNVPNWKNQPFLREFLVTPDTPLSMETYPPGKLFFKDLISGGNFLKKIAPRSRGSFPFGGQFLMVGGQFFKYEKIGKKKYYRYTSSLVMIFRITPEKQFLKMDQAPLKSEVWVNRGQII